MLCKIADLITEIPQAGGLASRCREYLYSGEATPDITIRMEDYRLERYSSQTPQELIDYMESGAQFYRQLLEFNGFYIHASTVVLDGKAYLFSGHSTAGKSTHTCLWQQVFGSAARVINDDKPALRRIDGVWYAYGTPWCGKDGININERAPIAGVCFMKKAADNHIRRLTKTEALQKVLGQTIRKSLTMEQMDRLITALDDFLRTIPVYELENRPESEAARLSYETMRAGAEEADL